MFFNNLRSWLRHNKSDDQVISSYRSDFFDAEEIPNLNQRVIWSASAEGPSVQYLNAPTSKAQLMTRERYMNLREIFRQDLITCVL